MVLNRRSIMAILPFWNEFFNCPHTWVLCMKPIDIGASLKSYLTASDCKIHSCTFDHKYISTKFSFSIYDVPSALSDGIRMNE